MISECQGNILTVRCDKISPRICDQMLGLAQSFFLVSGNEVTNTWWSAMVVLEVTSWRQPSVMSRAKRLRVMLVIFTTSWSLWFCVPSDARSAFWACFWWWRAHGKDADKRASPDGVGCAPVRSKTQSEDELGEKEELMSGSVKWLSVVFVLQDKCL